MIKVSLTNMGKTYEAEGDTVTEALNKIQLRAVAGKSILVISNKDNKIERVLPHTIARRAFTMIGMTREVAIKNLSLLFNNL